MNIIKANNSTEAWELLNEAFITKDPIILTPGDSAELTNSWFLYNTLLEIENPRMDPEFDYSAHFHYTMHKWSNLISNYLNLNNLDQVKAHLLGLEKEMVKIRHYNVGFNFTDNHNNGKGCLLSGIFSHSLNSKKPCFTIYMRAAEVTTRFAVDLLFFQRMGEYIYGEDNFTLKIFIHQIIAMEHVIVLYNNHKKITRILKDCKNEEHAKKIKDRVKDMLNSPEEKYAKYATHFRAYKIIRSDIYPAPKPLLVKDMVIGNWDGIPIPKNCITPAERNLFSKRWKKFAEKYQMDISGTSPEDPAIKGNIITFGNTSTKPTGPLEEDEDYDDTEV